VDRAEDSPALTVHRRAIVVELMKRGRVASYASIHRTHPPERLMFTGFAKYTDGTTETLASIEDLARAWAREGSIVWVDFEAPTEADLRELDKVVDVDDSSLDDCLSGQQRPRIDEFDDHIFIVLYGLIGPGESEEFDPRKLSIFFGPRFIITLCPDPIRTIRTMIERARRDPALVIGAGVDRLLHAIIDSMADKYLMVAERYETRLEGLEEASLDPDVNEAILSDSAELRRELLSLRNLAVSQREMLSPIAGGEYEHISEALERRFRHVQDHFSQVVELIDRLREQLHGVRENYHTAVANSTNAIMKTLTIFATILLPLTFVAGIYGMNLPLWPPPDAPSSFWWVVGCMSAIALGMLFFFRRKRWL
jgi:magnesium transporter